jgi:predicted HicB family RNase H-like nuclease
MTFHEVELDGNTEVIHGGGDVKCSLCGEHLSPGEASFVGYRTPCKSEDREIDDILELQWLFLRLPRKVVVALEREAKKEGLILQAFIQRKLTEVVE